ncbi:SDR family NAD(P)-dependent oxidoreductase OS=Streptomyces rimosus subsp. rimosus (strain ATCC/ DSM 40260 / JCM 4667 / NRRL 2234) OX=1265868 GN=SRIM_036780 PE=3 SV=1 [Streptomyces rimosus subsp. rimosus]
MAPRHFRGDDRVAVITGAGRGIGESLARELTQHGFRVVLGDIDKAAVQATAMAVGARAVPVAGDMRDPRTAAALVQAALQGFGRLDVWINNAGVIGDGPFEEQVPAHAARMVEVNLGAVLAGCRAGGRSCAPRAEDTS